MTTSVLLFGASRMADAFWQGFWEGVFQLVALGIVAFVVNIVYQRHRVRRDSRQELIDGIDEFTVSLYRPRKIYQTVLADTGISAAITDQAQRQTTRYEVMHRCLEDLVDAVGRFRSMQVKIVPLYGYHVEIFSHYLAIWRYLKEIRKRMERGATLYFHHESSDSVDAFYRLIDQFRYMVMAQKFVSNPPGLVRPPKELLEEMRKGGNRVYEHFFSQGTATKGEEPLS